MSPVKPLAVFDFDGTLCPGDSILPFLMTCIREGIAPRTQLLKAARGYLGQRAGLISPGEAKSMTLSFLKGLRDDQVAQTAAAFAREELFPKIPRHALTLLRDLRDAGWFILLVSASTDVYMRFLPDLLGADGVISTICECTDSQPSVYTGRVLSNCRDEEKVSRLYAWHALHPDVGFPPTLGFGDSRHDAPMLAACKTPVLVSPDRTLRREFPQAPVLDWSQPVPLSSLLSSAR